MNDNKIIIEDKNSNYKDARKTFSYLLFCLVVYYTLSYVTSMGMSYFIKEIPNNLSQTLTGTLLFAAQYIIAFPVTAYLLTRKKTEKTEQTVVPVKTIAGTTCMCFTSSVTSNIVTLIIIFLITSVTGLVSTNPLVAVGMALPYPVMFVFSVIVAPIVEELLFRKWFIDHTYKYGQGISVLAAALCFGLFHANVYQFLYAFLIGFILSTIYIKTKKIIYPIIIHMIFNFFGSIVLPLQEYLVNNMPAELLEIDITMSPEKILDLIPDNIGMLMLVSMAVILVGLGMLTAAIIGTVFFFKNKTFFKLYRAEIDVPKNKFLMVMFGNVGGAIFLIGSIALTVYNFILFLQ